MKKTNYFLNFIKSYRNIFFKVFLFELFFSIKFKDFFNNIVIHNNEHRTDTVPCVYYFLFIDYYLPDIDTIIRSTWPSYTILYIISRIKYLCNDIICKENVFFDKDETINIKSIYL